MVKLKAVLDLEITIKILHKPNKKDDTNYSKANDPL
jgi:hypothetical protein